MATIGSLVFKIGTDTAEIIDGVNKINSKLDTMPAALEKVQSRASAWGSFVGNVMADVASKVGRLAVDAIGDLVSRSEKMGAVGTSFERLTATVGETGEAFLKVSRGSAKGLISDLDLMQAANKGILLGLPITSSSFSKLAETSIVLGRAMGQGPNQSLNDLITALGRSSPLILDNLGLTVKVGEANDKYAAQLGKSSSALTDTEKKMAFYNAAMDAASTKVQALGGIQSQSTDIITRVKVAWDNLLDRMAGAIAKSPVLTSAMTLLGDAMEKWASSSVNAASATNKVDDSVLRLMKIFDSLLGVVGVVQTAFNGFQAGIASIFENIAQSVASKLVLITGGLQTLAKIPGPMGDSFRVAFATIRDWTHLAAGATESYSQLVREQGEDYRHNANAIDEARSKLQAFISTHQAGTPVMTEAAAVVRESTEAAETFGKSIFDMGLKIGNGFGLIKQHTTKVDIKEVMDRSIDSFRNVKIAADQSVPGFVSVGKAATSLFDDLKKSTTGVMGLSSALSSFSGSQFGANFGSSMGFGQGMGIAGPAITNQAQWNAYMKSAGFFHTGGGIGFSGMKRYHSGGLMQGEVPIVAQEGEGILSRRGMAALSRLNAGGTVGGASINVTVNAQGSFFETPEARERLARVVGDAVIAKMKSHGARI